MRTVLISDIHSNIEALSVVLDDVAKRSFDRMVCLGDVIGYGPDPCPCIDLVETHCEWSLLGNHDFACFLEPTNFNPIAAAGSYWTRAQVEPLTSDAHDPAVGRRQAFLFHMRPHAFLDDNRNYLLVHASPRKPISEYLFADDVRNPGKLTHAFGAMPGNYAFVGHTHVPGVLTAELDRDGMVSADSLYDYDYGNELDAPFSLDTKKGSLRFIVNPGSVGQPRDGDPRASYAILDVPDDRSAPSVEFIRLEYPAEVTRSKILAKPELADRLGDRLLKGE